MPETTVWDLAEECDCSVATVVFQLVNVGMWKNDGSVSGGVADTIRVFLNDPERRNSRTPHQLEIDIGAVAAALLEARAYEVRVTAAQLASATGATIEAVDSTLSTLVEHRLAEQAEDGSVIVNPEMARELRALATGDVVLEDYDAS